MANIDLAILFCDDCGRQFKSKYDLPKHMRNIHRDYLTLTCDLCSKGFGQKMNLVQHIRFVHQHINSDKCHLCAAQYSSKTSLRRHYSNIHQGIKFECDDCGKLFAEKINLATHISAVHKQLHSFGCLLCGAKYRDSSHLKRHTAVKHNRKQVQCDHCGETFGRKSSLPIHIRSVHLKFCWFKCSQCSAAFKSRANRNHHEQIIHKRRRFICDICSKKFSEKNHLSEHCSAVHMGLLRIFKCSVCERAFHNSGSLWRHQKIHG